MSLSSYFIPIIGLLTSILIIDNSTLLKETVKSKIYAKISEKEITPLYQKIEHAFWEEKYYRNNELTLVSLAQDLNLSANKLSYVLSSSNTSFKKFINTIRIQKATEFMKTKKIEPTTFPESPHSKTKSSKGLQSKPDSSGNPFCRASADKKRGARK